MSPSAIIIAGATSAPGVVDVLGRRIALRRLTALDKLRLFKAAGPALSQNQHWLGMAMLACSVSSIDDVPVPAPATEQQIEAMVERLGDVGINAIAETLNPDPALSSEEAITAGN
ncbi:MAG: hypothetical protein ABI369_13730 [Acetobacteraceae bacterium]